MPVAVPAAALHQIFEAYCTKKGLTKDQIRFLQDGTRIQDHQTPEEVRNLSAHCLLPPSARNSRRVLVSASRVGVHYVGVLRGRTERVGGRAQEATVGTQ